jgi:capsular polysaccharide export protein
MALYSAFRRVLIDRCLIRGGLLSEQGLQMLIDNAAERLTRRPSKRAQGGEPRLVHDSGPARIAYQ